MNAEDETAEQESNSFETEENEEEKDESASKTTMLPSRKSEADSGVVYMSRIPRFMNVKMLREHLSRCGKIGRVFLQPDGESRVCKKSRIYKEGWVEFKEKKHAKRAAKFLNGQEVQSKHKSPWAGEIWNIKYLSKFRWRHLGESLAFEKAAHKMRLQAEYSKVKRTANFRLESIQKAETLKKIKDKRKNKVEAKPSDINFERKGFYQKQTEEEILKRKKAKLKEGETNRFEKKTFAGNQKGCLKIFSAAFSS